MWQWHLGAASPAFTVGRGRVLICHCSPPATDNIFRAYVTREAMRMAHACRNAVSRSSPVMWLGYQEWKTLVS